MYSTHNEGKSVVAERFFRTLKNKIYKHMTAVLKAVYSDKLVDMVDKYNNIYHGTIKMKPVDVKYSTYITYSTYDDHSVESNDKDPKFEVDDHLGISKYKNVFAKGNPPHWSEEYFVTKKVKNVVL